MAVTRPPQTAYPSQAPWPCVPKELDYQYRHKGCWLQESTERHPEVVLVSTSVYMTGDEIYMNLAAHGPPAVLRRLEEEWKADPRTRKVAPLSQGPGVATFHVGYASKHTMFGTIVKHRPVSIGTSRYAKGVEHHNLVGEPGDLQDLLDALRQEGEVTVTSVREAGASAAPSSLLDGLTPKQREALALAHREGYFEWPRRCSADELAERLGVSHTAFLGHLRKAEARIMDAAIAEVQRRAPETLAVGAPPRTLPLKRSAT